MSRSIPKSSGSPALNVEYDHGLHLADSVLWLDAPRRADLCFLSHAHEDFSVRHKKILTTTRTATLARKPGELSQALLSPFGQRFSLGDLDLELFPAGHLLGSAMLRVVFQGESLLYTGHFTLEKQRTAEAAEPHRCDLLLMEATYGHPRYAFPQRCSVEQDILDFVKGCAARGEVPVFLTPPLGKAQELIHLLNDHNIPVFSPRRVIAFCERYDSLGVGQMKVRRLRRSSVGGEVLILPPAQRRVDPAGTHAVRRTALLSGRGVEKDAARRLGVDRVFPLSSHADYPGLLRMIRESGAKKVILFGRYASRLADELRAQRLNVWALPQPQQLELFPNQQHSSGQPADGQ